MGLSGPLIVTCGTYIASYHISDELAQGSKEARKQGREGVAPWLKFRDPHLAGGAKQFWANLEAQFKKPHGPFSSEKNHENRLNSTKGECDMAKKLRI